jgi:hypothetical protein
LEAGGERHQHQQRRGLDRDYLRGEQRERGDGQREDGQRRAVPAPLTLPGWLGRTLPQMAYQA